MGFLDYFKSPDINQGFKQFKATPGALLLDVRNEDEYAAGHLPGSINLPMQRLGLIDDIAGADTPLFTYCLSGGRSRKAASILKVKGYTVTDIGGINGWKGADVAEKDIESGGKLKLVIVGGVAGGASAAARARRLNEQAEIVVFERSGYISYANCGLPYYIGGTIRDPEDLTLQTPDSFYSRFRVRMHVHHEVTAIHPERKTVRVKNLETGAEFEESYDKLLLSPGARPTRPKLPGSDVDRLFTLRTVEDSFRIRDFVVKEQPRSVVLAGGGFIALELAENLRELGMDVTIVQRPKQLLRPLDSDMAAFVHGQFRKHGVKLALGHEVLGFEDAKEGVRVLLKDAAPLTADMVVLAIGVTPDTHLAKEAGLKLGMKGSILVNDYMETSEPDIYAVGDAVQVKHFVSGEDTLLSLAGPANRQGRIAADNICGGRSRYTGSQGSAIVKLFDMTAAVTGLNESAAKAAGIVYDKVFLSPASHAGYYPGGKVMSMKVLFEKGSGRLLGAQIVGYEGVDKRIDVLATAIHAGMRAADLAELDLAYAPPFSSAKDPVNMVGFMAENIENGILKQFFWDQVDILPRDGSVTLLDTRTEAEYARGHFDGFLNIPVDELRERIHELEAGKPIYVNCQSGLRSYIACRILAGHGFDCYNFSGGYRVYEAIRHDKALIEQALPCGMDR
ncbi:MAG: CoA-disulfide reductase [Ruminococcaceae bacterium]|nr:CoA-disulfide reductase [Oscillospiraceae bacterium]